MRGSLSKCMSDNDYGECPTLFFFYVKFSPLTKNVLILMNVDVKEDYHLKVASHVLPLELRKIKQNFILVLKRKREYTEIN